MNRRQRTAGTVCGVLAVLALPFAPWPGILLLGFATVTVWESL